MITGFTNEHNVSVYYYEMQRPSNIYLSVFGIKWANRYFASYNHAIGTQSTSPSVRRRDGLIAAVAAAMALTLLVLSVTQTVLQRKRGIDIAVVIVTAIAVAMNSLGVVMRIRDTIIARRSLNMTAITKSMSRNIRETINGFDIDNNNISLLCNAVWMMKLSLEYSIRQGKEMWELYRPTSDREAIFAEMWKDQLGASEAVVTKTTREDRTKGPKEFRGTAELSEVMETAVAVVGSGRIIIVSSESAANVVVGWTGRDDIRSRPLIAAVAAVCSNSTDRVLNWSDFDRTLEEFDPRGIRCRDDWASGPEMKWVILTYTKHMSTDNCPSICVGDIVLRTINNRVCMMQNR